jgi:uncharacterized membrane-anchored protein
MLIQKKIEKGKLTIYISIIIIMIMGVIFFIYKSYSLEGGGGAIIMEAPSIDESMSSGDYNLDKLSENVSITEEEDSRSENENIISPAVEADEISDLIDLSLFSEMKFKMLKENTLKSEEYETGRSNPFAPY